VEVEFRADRVERLGAEECWIDFKTGKPDATSPKAETRSEQLLVKLARGERLQAALYALAGPGRIGRYVHLNQDLGEARSSSLRGDDPRVRQTWTRVLAVLEDARAQGAFFPRLYDPRLDQEPEACAHCRVALACSRGDSQARARLVEGLAEPLQDASAAERAARALWHLPQAEPEGAA